MIRNHSTFQKLSLLFTLVIGAPLANAQQTTVTGTVTEPGGEPLIGVTVTVPGTKTGTVTDIDGKYSLNADAKDKIKFTYIGYEPVE